MKDEYKRTYFICEKCDKIYNDLCQLVTSEPTDIQRKKLLAGYCNKCLDEVMKNIKESKPTDDKIKVTHWDYDIVDK